MHVHRQLPRRRAARRYLQLRMGGNSRLGPVRMCVRHVWGRHVQLPYYVAGMRGAAAHEARLRWRAPAATRANSAGSGWRAALWRSGRAAQSPMRGRDT